MCPENDIFGEKKKDVQPSVKLHAVLLKYKQHDFKCPEAVFSEEETAVWSVG